YIWNITSIGQLIWQIIENKEVLWVKWVHGIYLKDERSIWNHKVPIECSWYWRKLNAIKYQMQKWYCQSYQALLGHRPHMKIVDLIWTVVALPKHRFMVWLEVQGRLLTQEKKLRLHIPVEDNDCCLCDEQTMETTMHLFEECSWTKSVWQELMKWVGITLTNNEIKQVLECIKVKHWKQFQKEVVAAISGAILYHTWRARNWKKFNRKSVHREEVVTQIKKELIERLYFLSKSKKARNCSFFIQHL
ncbi:hypothetical protein MTR67_005708, partial [Solanum verrucosum]